MTPNPVGDCLRGVPGCCYRARQCLVARVLSSPPTSVEYINGSTLNRALFDTRRPENLL